MKKFILPVAILIFILLALGVTLFLVKQRQDVRKKAAPATTLSFSPAVLTKNVGDTFTLNVMMDTSENLVSAAELHVNYPATMEGVSIVPGTMLTKIISPPQPSIGNGSATIVLGAETATVPASGQGVVAVITFKILQASALPVKISLDPASQVAAYGDRGNVISSMQDATITIGSAATATPTVTLTPAVTNTPTPTEEQQAETTETPTPTETAAAEDTSTPTPTKTTTVDNASSTFSSTSEQALTLTNPGDGQIITSSKPVIKGKAKPGTKIVITIRSEEQTVTVVADANGNWQATPPTALDNGEHTIIAQANSDSVSTSFTVGLPETATITPTIVIIFIGGILLLMGTLRLATL